MKKFRRTPRALARGILVVALSGAGVVAAAGSASAFGVSKSAPTHRHAATPGTKFQQWVLKRQAIATAFRDAVANARAAFNLAKATATTSADRYAARTVFDAAIAQAAEARSAALIALGPPPKSGGHSNIHITFARN
ncbi:MAG: hypothetical protein KGJ10_05880 [Acidobacteriota bacterium]|nr:hypothetical protein [Acidobacteriota bacterium]MDE3107426.1 hypothetical protein [Acidobacteriota bacterium]